MLTLRLWHQFCGFGLVEINRLTVEITYAGTDVNLEKLDMSYGALHGSTICDMAVLSVFLTVLLSRLQTGQNGRHDCKKSQDFFYHFIVYPPIPAVHSVAQQVYWLHFIFFHLTNFVSYFIASVTN